MTSRINDFNTILIKNNHSTNNVKAIYFHDTVEDIISKLEEVGVIGPVTQKFEYVFYEIVENMIRDEAPLLDIYNRILELYRIPLDVFE